jgi:hypothetical protein
MNRRRPYFLRPVTRHVTLRDIIRDSSRDVTPVTLHRRLLLLCGFLSLFGAITALACAVWAPGIVLGAGSAAFLHRQL